ncbi:MAG TPA: PEGA domain-containing protein [Polyangia bacterium]|nr:PEGA domain-containing protein [Polyangia bacterium]
MSVQALPAGTGRDVRLSHLRGGHAVTAAGKLSCLSALAAALTTAAAPRAARAGEKIAVLVLGSSEKDAELADNLTEVLIAYVAQHGGFEIAGKEEFRARLGVENERRAQDCLDDISCLGRAGVSLGVRRIVAGSVGTRGKQFRFNLNLDNIEDGKVESRVFRLVEGGVEDLIKAVQEASGELFRPHVEPGKIQIASQPDGARVAIDNAYLGVTPLISGTLLAGKHNVRVEADGHFPWASRVEVLPGQELQIKLSPENLPRRRAWPSYAAYGSAALAVASIAAGGFLGELSQLQPNGNTRQLAMDDLDQKRHFALAANISFGAGVVLGAVSLYYFIRYHDDIFGRTERYDDAP